jgi:hypothetical protein
MGIAKFFGALAGKRDDPLPRLFWNFSRPSRARKIV